MTTEKLKAKSEDDLKNLIEWFKKRFPTYTQKDLIKFIKAVK